MIPKELFQRYGLTQNKKLPKLPGLPFPGCSCYISTMLQLVNLTKEFSGKPLFSHLTWHLKKGERVALVGENGAGKSTLMKIIAGLTEASSGTIQLAKSAVTAYLPQDGIITQGHILAHEARTACGELYAMEQDLHRLAQQLEQLNSSDADHDVALQRYGELQEIFRHRGGYSMEAEIGGVLKGLGFADADMHRDCGEFSGGWQMRIALARLLLQKPEVLLLDEPTNHLDIEARNWLEEYLTAYPGSVILVSHDRFFMDRVCSKVVELWNHTLTEYHGNYSTYLSQRDERIRVLEEAKRQQDEEIAKTEDFIRRFRYQANKASLVQSRIKQLDKIERIVLPPERKKIRFRFPTAPKSGRIVMELRNLTRSFGSHRVLNGVNLVVEKGERIALVGHNGAGKSTLMGVLAQGGHQQGERTAGHNVILDYFAQDQATILDPARSVYDELYADAPFEMVPVLRDILGAFLFSGDDIHKKTAVLSGGERNRLALAKMLLRPSNLLLMDEPTNHLDLFSKDVLLDALKSYDGTLVFVSHDRYFVNSLATRIVEVDHGTLESYYGDYEYYLEKNQAETTATICPAPAQSTGKLSTEPSASFQQSDKNQRLKGREEEKQRKREETQRQKRIIEIEQRISTVETEIASLEADMNSPGFFDDAQQGIVAGERHGQLNQELEALYLEWEQRSSACPQS